MTNTAAANGRRQTETIAIKGGVQYAKVSKRLLEMHEDCSKCSIETTVDFREGWALISCRLTTPKGVFTGHSLGQAKGDKNFEKLETIAVGRALAFGGYLASGEIASYDEVNKFTDMVSANDQGHDQFVQAVLDKCDAATSTIELSKLWNRIGQWLDDETIGPPQHDLLVRAIRRRSRELGSDEFQPGVE